MSGAIQAFAFAEGHGYYYDKVSVIIDKQLKREKGITVMDTTQDQS